MQYVQIIALLTVILCFVSVLVFAKTTSYLKAPGVVLFFIGFSALIFRISLNTILPISIYNKGTFALSFLVLLTTTIVFMIYVFIKTDKLITKKKYFFKLLFPYLFFGALEQIFFLIVFTDAVIFLVRSKVLLLAASTLFFTIFHLTPKSELKKQILLISFFGLISSYTYIYLGNAIPQMLFHGVLGSLVFTAYSKKDQLKKRLG